MTFEALLTFLGILVAVLALIRPVQRRSLRLFVPAWRMSSALLLSLALIVCRDAPLGVPPPFGWPLSTVLFALTLLSFLVPVAAALWSLCTWRRAKLTDKNIGRVEGIFRAALQEREFDEVERVVRNNQEQLTKLPPSAAAVLFDPAMVQALVASHSLIHLELLADMQFLKSLENRFGAVDVVVRELLRSGVSPVRSAVVSRYGGLEHLFPSETERELIEQTFQNPEWYFEASAHYPLVISAVEELQSGKHDTEYNLVGRDYQTSQGVSKRAYCPIYLAVKTEVLAVKAALEGRIEKEFYVSDLFQIFDAVLQRSTFEKTVWENSLSNAEFPTPYAYLLYEIAADFQDLSATALQAATSDTEPSKAEKPGRVAQDLAQNWSFSVWRMAGLQGKVAPEFLQRVIRQYLVFVLQLGWEPSEIYLGPVGANIKELEAWRDLFLKELKMRFFHDHKEMAALEAALESLDKGKSYVSKGYEWLEKELVGGA